MRATVEEKSGERLREAAYLVMIVALAGFLRLMAVGLRKGYLGFDESMFIILGKNMLSGVSWTDLTAGVTGNCAVGDIDGNGDRGYYCGTGTAVSRNTYPPTASWNTAFATNNDDFENIILVDIDSDGKDEIFGIKSAEPEKLYRYDYGGGNRFRSVPPLGTMFLFF